MATRQKGRGASSSTEQGAIEMLMADHKKVKKLFSDFKKLKDDGSNEEKAAIVDRICDELKVHAAIEEEIFYPAVRKQIDDSDLVDGGLVEHAGAKDLIAQLEEMGADDDLYDAKVTVLGEQIDHHVKEEEGDMFKKAKKANVDTAALGATMLKRKQALMTDTGLIGSGRGSGNGSPGRLTRPLNKSLAIPLYLYLRLAYAGVSPETPVRVQCQPVTNPHGSSPAGSHAKSIGAVRAVLIVVELVVHAPAHESACLKYCRTCAVAWPGKRLSILVGWRLHEVVLFAPS